MYNYNTNPKFNNEDRSLIYRELAELAGIVNDIALEVASAISKHESGHSAYRQITQIQGLANNLQDLRGRLKTGYLSRGGTP